MRTVGNRAFLILVASMIGSVGCNSSGGGDDDPGDDLPAVDSFVPRIDGGPPLPPDERSALRLTDGTQTWTLDGVADTADADLVGVPGHSAFWFAWSVFNPGTPLFDHDPVREATIESEAECTVPCDEIRAACAGRDCIPQITSPVMVPAGDPTLDYLAEEDLVLGVLTSEGPRAYPHNILWWHEIINEEVGGEAFTVTLCPLTGSALMYDRNAFVPGETVTLGVSGLLYNSNLVMYDDATETFWSQMKLEAVQGSELDTPSPVRPVLEMTWAGWRALHPDTLVVSGDTGLSRDYTRYPYTSGGDYRTNDADTFRETNPLPDPSFANKDMVFGVTLGELRKGYVYALLEQAAGGPRGVVHDTVGGTEVAVVFDLEVGYVHAFERPGDAELSFAE